MKLGILTTLWHRPSLTHIFLDRLMRLQSKYNVIAICVGSDNEFKDACDSREIFYLDYENRPLGSKWNAGLQLFQATDVTNVMTLGSDDFVSDNFIEHAMNYAWSTQKDFCGAYDLWIYGANIKRRGFGVLWYFRYRGFLVGPGRMYSRKALTLANWKLWHPSKNSGLDGSSAKTMRLLGDKIDRGHWINREEDIFVIDIKTSGGNISSIPGAAKMEKEGDINQYLDKYLPQEADALKQLIHEEASVNNRSGVIRSYDSSDID